MYHQEIVRDIQEANLGRSPDNIQRRLLKIMEEIGEASEAFLSRTSVDNYKNKSWADFREESIDILIVLVDVALTDFPEGNFPPATFLPIHLKDARDNRISRMADLEERLFLVARCVTSAQKSYLANDQLTFYGLLAKGIRAAADLVYSILPDDDFVEVDPQVLGVVKNKLDKWRARMAMTTDTVPTPLLKLVK